MNPLLDDGALPAGEAVSALMDGELAPDAARRALGTLADDERCECWAMYHLIGDVLRRPDMALHSGDAGLARRVTRRLALESSRSVLEPVGDAVATSELAVDRPAANDGVFRWKMVAGLASVAAVAALGWNAFNALGDAPAEGAQLAQGGAAPVRALMAQVNAPTVQTGATFQTDMVLRDPRLDELLAAHRQAVGASALGDAGGFLRNATFEGPAR